MPRGAISSKKHLNRRPLQSAAPRTLPAAGNAALRSDLAESSSASEQVIRTFESSASGQRGSLSPTQAVARWNEMGLTGVTDRQRQALRIVEEKMMKQEAIARARYQWTIAKGETDKRPSGQTILERGRTVEMRLRTR